jgi:O-antigen biosynthesis protein
VSDSPSSSPAGTVETDRVPPESLPGQTFIRFAALADRARDGGNRFLAAIYYEEALRLDPTHAAYWVQFGHALKESSQPARAETAYRTALAIEPDNADTHLQLGHLLKITQRRREALESYATANRLAPTSGQITQEFVTLRQELEPGS